MQRERDERRERRIVQVFTVEPTYQLVYHNADGTTFTRPVFAWGLTASGMVVPLDVDECCLVEDASEVANCAGVYREGDEEGAAVVHEQARVLAKIGG